MSSGVYSKLGKSGIRVSKRDSSIILPICPACPMSRWTVNVAVGAIREIRTLALSRTSYDGF